MTLPAYTNIQKKPPRKLYQLKILSLEDGLFFFFSLKLRLRLVKTMTNKPKNLSLIAEPIWCLVKKENNSSKFSSDFHIHAMAYVNAEKGRETDRHRNRQRDRKSERGKKAVKKKRK